MWECALWGLIGAATMRAIVFIEASLRVKSWPWLPPAGPGAALFTVTTVLHLGIAAAVTAALSDTPYVPNAAIAFGFGAAAPVVVRKVARIAQSLLPPEQPDEVTAAQKQPNELQSLPQPVDQEPPEQFRIESAIAPVEEPDGR
jgi:hypothetical protein